MPEVLTYRLGSKKINRFFKERLETILDIREFEKTDDRCWLKVYQNITIFAWSAVDV